MASFVAPLVNRSAARYVLQNSRNGRLLATSLETAFDSRSRNRGLLGRDRLQEGAALILAPCSSIHTFFMRFAIDVLFAARDGRLVKVHHAVRPWRIALGLGAFAAIELPAGAAALAEVRAGDIIALKAASEERGVWSPPD